tara:strand:- start:102 stop:737 length:636 start_codon:yes stop_codon:yes gene_type:complete
MKTKTKFQREKQLLTERPEYKCIGYARQSTNKQVSISAQFEELKKAGCLVVFQETVSSTNKERPQFEAALEMLEEGDELCLTKLDRAFKNQRQCINTLHNLQERGIHVRTTDGMINTRALGKFAPIVIGLLSGLGDVDRQMVIERTQESINYRRETGGNLGGRPKTNNEKEALVLRLRKEGCSYRSIRKQTGLALSTIRRIIVEQDVVIEV